MKLQEELDVQQAMEEKLSEMILANVKKDIAMCTEKEYSGKVALFFIVF